MAIHQTATPPRDAATRPIDDVQQLRQKINALINERDFWQTQAESKTARVEALTEQHRYRLTIHCDSHRCGHSISVSSSKPPVDGTLAYALLCAAAAMGWKLAAVTVDELVAAMPEAMRGAKLAPTGDADRCQAHQ